LAVDPVTGDLIVLSDADNTRPSCCASMWRREVSVLADTLLDAPAGPTWPFRRRLAAVHREQGAMQSTN